MPKDVWGNEIVVEPKPVTKRKKPQVGNYHLRQFKPISTDMTLWFSQNRPKTLAECADLKNALRTKSESKVGKYAVDVFETTNGKIAHVCGPAGEVALKSPAARKLFNRRLAGIEQIIEVYLKQFGTEEPVFDSSRPVQDLY